MSHEVETMAYAHETPWHGLGKRVHHDLTPAQMMKEAGVDWEVEKKTLRSDLVLTDKTRKTVSVPKVKGLFRMTDGKCLTVVGKGWNPVQNHEAFELFHEFVMNGDMEMHTAGSLKGGEIVWALAKVKESFALFGDDQIDSYMLFSNPHQYGKTPQISFNPIRVVCWNTHCEALEAVKGTTKKRINLTHRVAFDAEKVKEAMGIAKHQLHTLRDKAAFLGSKRYTPETLTQYFSEIWPASTEKKLEEGKVSKTAKLFGEVVETQPGAQYAEGSWWQAYNAVTFGVDHLVGKDDRDQRLWSSWFGYNRKKKVLALDKAIEFAQAS